MGCRGTFEIALSRADFDRLWGSVFDADAEPTCIEELEAGAVVVRADDCDWFSLGNAVMEALPPCYGRTQDSDGTAWLFACDGERYAQTDCNGDGIAVVCVFNGEPDPYQLAAVRDFEALERRAVEIVAGEGAAMTRDDSPPLFEVPESAPPKPHTSPWLPELPLFRRRCEACGEALEERDRATTYEGRQVHAGRCEEAG